MGFNSRRQRWFSSGAALDPSPDGGVVNWQASFSKKVLNVAIGERKSQIPPNCTGDHGRFEVAPFEQGWPRFSHSRSISGRGPARVHSFATLP